MSQFPGRHKKRPRRAPPGYEAFETTVLVELVQPGSAAVDIGACHGHYAINFARAVGPDCLVYAFEPDPTNFEALAREVARSGFTNIVIEQKAVSDKVGTADLYLNSKNIGDHRLYDSGDGRPSVKVETVRLDDYLSTEKRPVSVIKMDIQGSEARALAGMTGIVRENPGLAIAAEFWPFGLTAAGTSPVAFLRHLQRLGFDLHNMNERLARLETIKDAAAFTAAFPTNTSLYTNVLAVLPRPTDPDTTPPPS